MNAWLRYSTPADRLTPFSAAELGLDIGRPPSLESLWAAQDEADHAVAGIPETHPGGSPGAAG